MKKLVLWILLGVFSTALAEVSISSQPLAFFSTYGLLFVFPLYAVHILFFASLTMRKDRQVNFASLIFSGCLFGLYEAYITKVLWNPPWNEHTITVLQISLFTFLVLVFFYHTWMSFIFPLLLVEYFVFPDRRIFHCLPEKLRILLSNRLVLIVLLVFFGIANGVGESSLAGTILSVLGTSVVMLLFVLLARRLFSGNQGSLVDYLPRGKALVVIGFLLVGIYAIHLFTNRPEAFPGMVGHIMIGLFYLSFGFLLTLSKQYKSSKSNPELTDIPKLRKNWILYTGLYFTAAVLTTAFLKGLQIATVFILWGIGIPFGLYMFAKALHSISPRNETLSTDIPQNI
jgi:hypothetical protein